VDLFQQNLARIKDNAVRMLMIKVAIILMSLSLMVLGAFLVPAAFAGCSTCGGEQNWSGLAKLDEIGNPSEQDTAAPLWGPAAARTTNSQFERNASEGTADNKTESSVNTAPANAVQTQMPVTGIDLENISAEPNPAHPGSQVGITAVLSGQNVTAYALIRNSVGVQVGNVALEHTSGDEYVGTWKASIAAGGYNTTVVASASGASRTFADALRIDVEGSSESASDSSGYTKLG
jgi:hypothetical protein